MFHRGEEWEGATAHNAEVLLSWVDSSHALLLVVLATAGFVFVRFRSDWTRLQRSEAYLCLFLALGLGVHLSTARPTFERYYLFLTPFLSVPAAAGLYWIATRFEAAERPFRTFLVVALLLALGLGKGLFGSRDDLKWRDVAKAASLVDKVTPPNGSLAADEQMYFLTRRLPPEGMEVEDSHKLHLPPALARQLHVISQDELDQRIRSGDFATVEMQTSEKWIKKLEPMRIFRQQEHFEDPDLNVYWDRITTGKR
jgi:hypothetical protein